MQMQAMLHIQNTVPCSFPLWFANVSKIMKGKKNGLKKLRHLRRTRTWSKFSASFSLGYTHKDKCINPVCSYWKTVDEKGNNQKKVKT